MNKLLLIDGHNFLFRSFSIPFKFYSSKNTPLHVVTIFLKLLRNTLESINSDKIHVAIVFDTPTKTSNHELMDGYKANRKDYSLVEDNPFVHIPLVQKTLNNLGIRYFEIPNFEADDVIATIASNFTGINTNNKAYIASTDSDFYQLINKSVNIVKDNTIIGEEFVLSRLGIYPYEYVYFKSLVGDRSDNIPGVSGIGKIRARKIINKEIDIDLSLHKEIIERNMKLIELNKEVNIDLSFDDLEYSLVNLYKSNRSIFEECSF